MKTLANRPACQPKLANASPNSKLAHKGVSWLSNPAISKRNFGSKRNDLRSFGKRPLRTFLHTNWSIAPHLGGGGEFIVQIVQIRGSTSLSQCTDRTVNFINFSLQIGVPRPFRAKSGKASFQWIEKISHISPESKRSKDLSKMLVIF